MVKESESADCNERPVPRFWVVVNAWAIGQLTDSEFVREQRRIIGFVWLTPTEGGWCV